MAGLQHEERMGLSVIIPSYNYRNKLDITIKYLSMEIAHAGVEVEVLVVDDGSTDGTGEVIERWGQRLNLHGLTHQVNMGLARSRNDGARLAKFERILFMDSDIVMSPGVLASHVNFLRSSGSRDVLISNICNFEPENYQANEAALLEPGPFDYELFKRNSAATIDPFFDIRHQMLNLRGYREQNGFWLFGSMFCTSMPRSLWEAAGGFDEHFTGWGPEDIEFSYRLYKLGAIFHYDEQAICYHLDNAKKNREKLFADVQRNIKYFFSKFPNQDIKNYLRFAKGDISFEEYLCMLKNEQFIPEKHPQLNFLGIVKYLSEKST